MAAKPGSALGSHVLPLAGRFGARLGQAQPADVPRELLPSRRKFRADFYVTELSHLPNRSGKCVNKNESTGMYPQWLPYAKWKCSEFSFLFLGRQTFLSHLEKGYKYPFEKQFRLTNLPPQLINGKCSLQLRVHGRPLPLINI